MIIDLLIPQKKVLGDSELKVLYMEYLYGKNRYSFCFDEYVEEN